MSNGILPPGGPSDPRPASAPAAGEPAQADWPPTVPDIQLYHQTPHALAAMLARPRDEVTRIVNGGRESGLRQYAVYLRHELIKLEGQLAQESRGRTIDDAPRTPDEAALHTAIRQIANLADWIEDRIDGYWQWDRSQAGAYGQRWHADRAHAQVAETYAAFSKRDGIDELQRLEQALQAAQIDRLSGLHGDAMRRFEIAQLDHPPPAGTPEAAELRRTLQRDLDTVLASRRLLTSYEPVLGRALPAGVEPEPGAAAARHPTLLIALASRAARREACAAAADDYAALVSRTAALRTAMRGWQPPAGADETAALVRLENLATQADVAAQALSQARSIAHDGIPGELPALALAIMAQDKPDLTPSSAPQVLREAFEAAEEAATTADMILADVDTGLGPAVADVLAQPRLAAELGDLLRALQTELPATVESNHPLAEMTAAVRHHAPFQSEPLGRIEAAERAAREMLGLPERL
jgi:hypothetical protein